MNCNELKIWIKEHHELSRLPDTVQDHLQRCNDCRENINALMLSYQFIEMQKKVSLPDEKNTGYIKSASETQKGRYGPSQEDLSNLKSNSCDMGNCPRHNDWNCCGHHYPK
jgi:hypothetical protein